MHNFRANGPDHSDHLDQLDHLLHPLHLDPEPPAANFFLRKSE